MSVAALQAELDALRAGMAHATQAVIEIELQRLPLEDRIRVLTGAWDKTVKPGLMLQAEVNAALRQLKAFDVPFPARIRLHIGDEDLEPKT